MKLRIITVGNFIGVILLKKLLEKLRISKGDSLYVTEIPTEVELSPDDAEFASQMAIAEFIMGEDRDVLKKLAE